MLTTKNFLEDCVLEWGISVSKINEAYIQAYNEAAYFYKHLDKQYIKDTMSIILERENKLFIDNFMKCNHYDLKKFIEELYDSEICEEIVSTDFPSSQRPEKFNHNMSVTGLDIEISDEEQNKNNKEVNI
jgi:hypothetical protein